MDWTRGPPVLVGEKVLWSKSALSKPKSGVIKWIGNVSDISSDWYVGIELDEAFPSISGDGFWKGRELFKCRSGHGLLVPIKEIQKFNSKTNSKPISAESYSYFELDDTQLDELTSLDLQDTQNRKKQIKKTYYLELGKIKNSPENEAFNSDIDFKKENRNKASKSPKNSSNLSERNNQTQKKRAQKKNSSRQSGFHNSNINSEALKNAQTWNSDISIKDPLQNMNEITGYFKEIKEGDEMFEKPQQSGNTFLISTPHDTNDSGHSKPKKLFSFLKWFNKKHKDEPNLKLFKDSSVASSPAFPRKETSSCESIDTIFSTQTVRSFAYIPPTQYMPSAPPLDYERSSTENMTADFSSQKTTSEDHEPINDRKKKRKAPQPPRLTRENSLPTTLEFKKIEENFDGIKTYHRRTVSESFKDKKAGAYCHVQGKRKAPPPPVPFLYPNLQKLNNQYPSLYKKKKPAPPPPELNFENRNQNTSQETVKDIKKQDANQPVDEPKKKKSKDINDIGNEEKRIKLNQKPKDRLTKDVSLSPLPSRPWYKRNHRDSTGNNIIRKDFLRGFDKKTNKETDDWMPEAGFPKRSPSVESSHSKFNIFSKLDKSDEKKKEEKRKSQISILTNISELDREAAEIVKKEQAQEKKMMADNDAKYYSSKGNDVRISDLAEKLAKIPETFNNISKNSTEKNKPTSETKSYIEQIQSANDQKSIKDVKTIKDQSIPNEQSKTKADKENNAVPVELSNVNFEQNLLFSYAQTNTSNSSSQTSLAKISNPSQNSSQARLNYFNVQNKETNYLNEPWVCLKCTLENPGWRVFCEICRSVKPMFSVINLPKTQELEKKEVEKLIHKSELASLKTDEPKDLNLAVENSNQSSKLKPEPLNVTENEETSEESLDELRKKRLLFFTSKLDTLNQSDQNQSDSKKIKLKKILKEMRDSLSKEEHLRKTQEEDTDKKKLEEKLKDAKKNEKITLKFGKNPAPNLSEEENKNQLEHPQKSDIMKEESQKALLSTHQNIKDASELKTDYGNKSPSNKSVEVAEAYILTKTVVLEDIIIKKADRSQKVLSEAKPRVSNSSETKALRPPPRTKKFISGIVAEGVKDKETESSSKNGFSKTGENFSPEYLEELAKKLTQAEGLADFRADIETMPLNTEMNTVAVNRLLRKLESAINCGDHFVAASLAKELAMMKINCSVTRQVTPTPSTSTITADLYIEDKVSHQGPIALKVSPAMSLLQLKKKVEQEFSIPMEVQRWILGKKLAMDDNKTLEAEGVKTDYCPLFLYLVASENRKTNQEASSKSENNSESKLNQDTQPNKKSHKTKGWYYNDEEDHCSYCEDSEGETKNSRADSITQNKSEFPKKNNVSKLSETNRTTTQIDQIKFKAEKVPVFDLKTKDGENSFEKEMKFIPANSVKQKVEQLNKAFAENAKVIKPAFRSSRSPETWKCGACNVVNLVERLNCSSCSAKKVTQASKNFKNEPSVNKLLKKDNMKPLEVENNNVHYKTLVELQDADLVPNSEPFSCSICMEDYPSGKGVVLKDCLHTFCRSCLVSTVQFSEDAEVKCPYFDDTYSCSSVLQQREIKALVPQTVFEIHLSKSVKEAENKIDNAFHCKTPDCKGWCIYEDNVNEFCCPVCKSTNCLTCQVIHTGLDCREYQEKMRLASETDVDANKTRNMLNEMVEKGEAMACPKCQVVLMKKWGCDWLRCSMCKTEICWVTRGFRWGPNGKGDTSGGCKCGVNGVKCHPKCNYCH